MKAKKRMITVKGAEITIIKRNGHDYISITDMMRSTEGDFFIANWLRNRNTVEFLGVWEMVNNPDFNYVEFDIIKKHAGLNSYRLSIKEWITNTGAIGLISTAGRYGGTYAHVDIAFEFGMWISPEFKVYLIKEFNRLKLEENKRLNGGWNLQRALSKINYRIHTDAVKENLVPETLSKAQINAIYASEADLLNMALYGLTARDWRRLFAETEGNIRDHSTIEQLIVLSNLESLNAVLLDQHVAAADRLCQLNKVAIAQMKSLLRNGVDRIDGDSSLLVEEILIALKKAS